MLVQLEVSYKCIRKDTLFSWLNEKRRNNVSPEDINAEIQFKSIVTRYATNNKAHQIERIDFERSQNSEFKLKDRDITFEAYFKEKYGVSLKEQG